MRTESKILTRLLAFCLLFFFAVPLHAQKAQKVRITYASIGGQTLYLWIAQKEGLFRKHGLEAEVIYVPGSSAAVMALLAGDVQAAILGGPSIISANRKQVETVVVASFVSRLVMNLYGAKEITSLPQLKGKRIGITRFGTTSDFAARYALRKANLAPETDVALVQIGDQATRVAALRKSVVQATLVQPPVTLLMEREGFSKLVDMTEEKLAYPLSTLVVSQSFLRKSPETAQAMIAALAEAIFLLTENKEAGLRHLAEMMRLDMKRSDHREAVEESYRAYTAAMERIPYLAPEGVKTLVQQLSSQDSGWANLPFERLGVDMRLVQELERAGFFRKLTATKERGGR
ncbi:MAG: ABC transporter substrate-binding protein [Deltaproteobacteria bacterium]|nr:ABC transporter substrate-binding protein [Deltaproteobacteria bacterium]